MSLTLEAVVHNVKATQQITEKFQKREAIVCLDPSSQYPAYITLEATQKNVDLFDGIKKGDRIQADINLNGKLWTDKQGEEKAFTSLNVWSLSIVNTTPISTSSTPPPASSPDLPPPSADDSEDSLF